MEEIKKRIEDFIANTKNGENAEFIYDGVTISLCKENDGSWCIQIVPVFGGDDDWDYLTDGLFTWDDPNTVDIQMLNDWIDTTVESCKTA